jgi:hypothetical protein
MGADLSGQAHTAMMIRGARHVLGEAVGVPDTDRGAAPLYSHGEGASIEVRIRQLRRLERASPRKVQTDIVVNNPANPYEHGGITILEWHTGSAEYDGNVQIECPAVYVERPMPDRLALIRVNQLLWINAEFISRF